MGRGRRTPRIPSSARAVTSCDAGEQGAVEHPPVVVELAGRHGRGALAGEGTVGGAGRHGVGVGQEDGAAGVALDGDLDPVGTVLLGGGDGGRGGGRHHQPAHGPDAVEADDDPSRDEGPGGVGHELEEGGEGDDGEAVGVVGPIVGLEEQAVVADVRQGVEGEGALDGGAAGSWWAAPAGRAGGVGARGAADCQVATMRRADSVASCRAAPSSARTGWPLSLDDATRASEPTIAGGGAVEADEGGAEVEADGGAGRDGVGVARRRCRGQAVPPHRVALGPQGGRHPAQLGQSGAGRHVGRHRQVGLVPRGCRRRSRAGCRGRPGRRPARPRRGGGG